MNGTVKRIISDALVISILCISVAHASGFLSGTNRSAAYNGTGVSTITATTYQYDSNGPTLHLNGATDEFVTLSTDNCSIDATDTGVGTGEWSLGCPTSGFLGAAAIGISDGSGGPSVVTFEGAGAAMNATINGNDATFDVLTVTSCTGCGSGITTRTFFLPVFNGTTGTADTSDNSSAASDSASATFCSYSTFTIPADYSSGLTVALVGRVAAAGDGNDVVLKLSVTEVTDSANVALDTYTSGNLTVDMPASYALNDAWVHSLVPSGLTISAGDIFNVEHCRIGADAADTWASTIDRYGFKISYTSSN